MNSNRIIWFEFECETCGFKSQHPEMRFRIADLDYLTCPQCGETGPSYLRVWLVKEPKEKGGENNARN